MKTNRLAAATIVMLVVFGFIAATVSAQSAGQLRALKKRGEDVTNMKNDFVERVLKSYSIPYQLTPKGAVGRLQLGQDWVPVNRIEVVPIPADDKSSLKIKGHEIYFYTDTQILHLASSMIVN